MSTRAITNERRHAEFAAFRHQVWEKYGIIPFPHQADWILASEGWTLTDVVLDRMPRLTPLSIAAKQLHSDQPHQIVMLEDESLESRLLVPRAGGAAHALVDLAGFKGGKSFSLAMFASGFAGVAHAKVDFIGMQYDTSEPEFNYILEMLISERGMNLPYQSLRNNPKDGSMWLTLENNAHFQCRSYLASLKSDSLKGKTRDCYIFTEAYQLPGLHVYSRISQNLRELDGFACFATTPDRAWVTELHEKGHGKDSYWHCVCDIDAKCNPFTFDQAARDRDDPDKGGLMTRERFAVAWQGKAKKHIGAVYDFDKEANVFTPNNMPVLFKSDSVSVN